MQTLYLFSLEYNQSLDLKKILKNIKNLHADDTSLSDTMRNLVNIVNSLTNKGIEEPEESTENKKKKNLDFELPDMFNGAIGDLAKEIVEELDPSTINLDNPVELLSSLMNGKLDENSDSGIMNLIKNVTGKIEKKISSGSLNEEQLLSEARNMMGSLTQMNPNSTSEEGDGGMGNILGSMLSSLQGGGEGGDGGMGNMLDSMLGSLQGGGDMGGMGEMLKNMMSGLNGSSKKATIDNIKKQKDKIANKQRLRKKIEEKKRLLKEQEVLLDQELDNLDVPKIDDRDLDALVNEIENAGSSQTTRRKKKKKKKLETQEISQQL